MELTIGDENILYHCMHICGGFWQIQSHTCRYRYMVNFEGSNFHGLISENFVVLISVACLF